MRWDVNIKVSRKQKGIKKQIFGTMLFILGLTVIVFDLMTENGIELFYIIMTLFGCSLFIYGYLQRGIYKVPLHNKK